MSSTAKKQSKRADKWAKGPRNGSRSKTKIGNSFIAYCPECAHNASGIHVIPGQHEALCKNGHTFTLRRRVRT